MKSLREFQGLQQSIYVQIRFMDAIVPSHVGLGNLEFAAPKGCLTGL
jgi:hypothetical protein